MIYTIYMVDSACFACAYDKMRYEKLRLFILDLSSVAML